MMADKIDINYVRRWATARGILPRNEAPPRTDSTEVSFAAALEWALDGLQRYPNLPTFGTPAWRAEPDSRRAVASAVQAALLWALTVEAKQDHTVDASHEVSDALDWRAESVILRGRNSNSYIARRTA